MAARPRRSASTRSPMRSTSRSSCSQSGRDGHGAGELAAYRRRAEAADRRANDGIDRAGPGREAPTAIEAVEITQAKASARSNPLCRVESKPRPIPFVRADGRRRSPPPPTPPAEATAPPDAGPRRREPSSKGRRSSKAVHDDACKTFGTVLGPDANEAHKNHFHLDMKARRRRRLLRIGAPKWQTMSAERRWSCAARSGSLPPIIVQ